MCTHTHTNPGNCTHTQAGPVIPMMKSHQSGEFGAVLTEWQRWASSGSHGLTDLHPKLLLMRINVSAALKPLINPSQTVPWSVLNGIAFPFGAN